MEFTYKEIIVAAMLLAGLPAVLLGTKGLRWGFMVWVFTFALGYRTLPVTSTLSIHPAELTLFGLSMWLLILYLSGRNKDIRVSFWFPPVLWLFVLAWFWGWSSVTSGGLGWGLMFSEAKSFLPLIPLYFVAGTVLADRNSWRPVLLASYVVGAWIGGMGILEYEYPGVKTLLPGFMNNPVTIKTGEGFEHAAFSFWGAPDAVYLCVLALPIGIVLWRWGTVFWKRGLILVISSLMLSAVYVSGHRNAWIIITLQFGLFALLKKKYLVGVVILLLFISAYQLFPNTARVRLYSGAELIAGRPLDYDSSGQKRWDRVSTSLKNILDQPLGRGWAAAGWVHNDFLQVAENLGLVVGLLFFGFYLFQLRRLWYWVSAFREWEEQRTLGIVLLLSFISAGIILATDATLQLPQLLLPVWFVWVISGIWLRQTDMASRERAAIDDKAFDLSAFADLQLCDDRARYSRSG
jgi:hypothetical protein